MEENDSFSQNYKNIFSDPQEKDTNFLKELSDEQEQAVKYISGCSIISAGAGSGKTRVLTYKIAYLISIQVPPSSILALTFTNKAANEMKNRIIELLDNRSINELWMGTFHSIFLKILRENYEYLNEKYKLNNYFTIYDQKSKNTVLDPIIEKYIEVYKSAKKNNDRKIIQETLFEISDDISKIKNECKEIDECLNDPSFQLSNHSKSKIKKIYNDYVNKCRISNSMDFDDILLYTYNMLKDNEEIALKYKSMFKYILVDEYQDTNTIQFNIINLIHDKNCKICAVGDDAQCIYSFRGSKIENIQKFREKYSPLEFKLSVNYRSTKTIVEAANKLIQNNEGQSSKILLTNNQQNSLMESKIKIMSSQDDKDEARKVVEKIIELHNINKKINDWENFAILYRTHKQSEAFESQLKNSNVPYKIIGKIKFLERDIIVHIISYLRIIINQNDNISLQKIFNLTFSDISLKMKKIFDDADKKQISYWNVINSISSSTLKLKNLEKISTFIKFINYLKEIMVTKEPLYLIEQIVIYINSTTKINNSLFEEEDNKLIALLKQMADFLTKKYYEDFCDYKINDNSKKDKENIIKRKINNENNHNENNDENNNDNYYNNENQINQNSENNNDNYYNNENQINQNSENNENSDNESNENDLIVKYSLKEFLDDLILLNTSEDLTEEINILDPNNLKGKSNAVKLMTIHSSKGLEFNSVFIVGVERGYYPIYHPSIIDNKKHEEEERRMFYVAITRAKQNCFISYALRRLMSTGKVMNREKSQFINELENKCLDFSGDYGKKKEDDDFLSFDKSSFKYYLFNNSNNFTQHNNKKSYKNYNYNNNYLNKKRKKDFSGFKFNY